MSYKITKYLPEIFEELEATNSRKEKIAILHKYSKMRGMIEILCYCYDPAIEFVVTREEIESLRYDHMDIPDYDQSPATLMGETRRIRNYTNLRQPPIKHSRVLNLIANLFSVLHHDEIEIFKQMVARRIKTKGLTEKLVREAFPDLLTERAEEAPPEPPKEKAPVVDEEEKYNPFDTPPESEIVVDNDEKVE